MKVHESLLPPGNVALPTYSLQGEAGSFGEQRVSSPGEKYKTQNANQQACVSISKLIDSQSTSYKSRSGGHASLCEF